MHKDYDRKREYEQYEYERKEFPENEYNMREYRKKEYANKEYEEEMDLPLATAYIRNQPYEGLVPLQVGFKRGSMFPNLYQPYQKKEY